MRILGVFVCAIWPLLVVGAVLARRLPFYWFVWAPLVSVLTGLATYGLFELIFGINLTEPKPTISRLDLFVGTSMLGIIATGLSFLPPQRNAWTPARRIFALCLATFAFLVANLALKV